MGKIKGIQKLKHHNNLSPDALPRFGVSLPHDIPNAEEELERVSLWAHISLHA